MISQEQSKLLNIIQNVGPEIHRGNEVILYDIRKSAIQSSRADPKYANTRESMTSYLVDQLQISRVILYVSVFPTDDFEYIRSIYKSLNVDTKIIFASNRQISIENPEMESYVSIEGIKSLQNIDSVIMFDSISRIENFADVMTDICRACSFGARIIVSDIDAYDYRTQIYEDLYYIARYVKYRKLSGKSMKYTDIVDYFSNYHSFKDLIRSMRLLGFAEELPTYANNRSIYYAVFRKTTEIEYALNIFGINTKYNIRNPDVEKSLHAGLVRFYSSRDYGYVELIADELDMDASIFYNRFIKSNIMSNEQLIKELSR